MIHIAFLRGMNFGRRRISSAELVARSKGKVQVSMLATAPVADVRKRALALATDEDLLSISGRELYWLPSGGVSDSDLDLHAIGGLLGSATMRTKGTIEGIAAKLQGDGRG